MTTSGNAPFSPLSSASTLASDSMPMVFSHDEARRLAQLELFDIMYSEKEAEFDRITRLVKAYIDVAVVGITFIDHDSQFVKSSVGMSLPVLPRTQSICDYTIRDSQPFIVPDTLDSAVLHDHPLVVGEPFVRFYAGFPILVHNAQGEQFALGALCLADTQPRAALTQAQCEVMQDFARVISDTLRLRLERLKATRANHIKTAFLANMSHEIHTPMSGIVGMLDALSQTNLDEQQIGYVNHVKNANEHLMMLVNDMLDLSQIESGKLRFERQSVDLKTLAEQLIASFAHQAMAKQVTLQLDYQITLPNQFRLDKKRVEQIIGKLIGNAIQFTPAGGQVTLGISNACVSRACKVDTDGQPSALSQHICMQVSDTGVGIPPQTQAVIFDAYEQAETPTHRMYSGVGLGLSLCKALALGMGGDLMLKSEVGQGTTFCLQLPLDASDIVVAHTKNQTTEASVAQSAHPQLVAPTRHSAHILLVEDNEINAMVALKTLKKYGYTADRAKDGQEAVAIFSESPTKYQIILMDHQMPIMDGVQATKVLKERFDIALPPVIAVTAHATHGDQSIYFDVGMKDCIAKPYKPELLDSVIQKWLDA